MGTKSNNSILWKKNVEGAESDGVKKMLCSTLVDITVEVGFELWLNL